MLPKRIYLQNFMGHIESDIDCTKFTSCLIVGKNKNNPNVSNGVGKSTIYKAIDFVLYGEYACDKIEEIIRDDADSCKVIFEFEMDKSDYQVIRQRGKSGTHIYLSRLVSGAWESISGKTNTQTETELLKLIKISFKAFKNSILFAQADLDGISSATPDKRKELLKEPLNILIYNKFHKIAKTKFDEQSKDLDKNKYLIENLGNPTEDLKICSNQIIEANIRLDLKKKNYEAIQVSLDNKRSELNELEKLVATDSVDINSQLIDIKQRVKETESDLLRTTAELNNSVKKMNEFKVDLATKNSGLQDKTDNLKKLKSEQLRTQNTIQSELDLFIEKEQRGRVLIAGLESDRIKFSRSIPEIGECTMCLQEITDQHKNKCAEDSQKKLELVNINLAKYNDLMKKCLIKRKALEQEQRETSRKLAQIDSFELEIANWKNNINKTQELVNQYNQTLEAKNNDILRLNATLDSLKAKQEVLMNNVKKTNLNDLNNKILAVKESITQLEFNIKRLLQEISSDDTLNGILKEKKSNIELNIIKLNQLVIDQKIIEAKVLMHQKVVKAFSSNGVPSLIINTILDDLQIEANILLSELRPSLQFQFKLDKDNDDLLDIVYTVHGKERSYKLLSGGQRLFIALSLKLGLSKIIQRRLGVDIKFLELDEVDSSLDEDGVEALAEVIKKWQNDFTIFLITHNKNLKDKFNNYIIVEGDDSNGSKARYSTTWDMF